MLVLPRRMGTVSIDTMRPAFRPLARPQQQGGGRAVVLEPFATELGIGAQAADPVASALRGAGWSVDTGVDSQVSVQAMTTIGRYGIVYMHTHSGVSQSGAGVVATGQPADGDPSVQQYLADGSVIAVGVAGSSATYYGITSRFITLHVGAMSRGALVFVNGCALLQTTDFWSALGAAGAGVLVSWTDDSTNSDNYLSGIAFFNVMAGGSTVQGAIATLQANGLGISQYGGRTARMGFQGNGGETLATAAAGSPGGPPTSIPTSVPTSTPRPTSTATLPPALTATPRPTSTPPPSPTRPPTATATATPTATAIPLRVSLLRTSVKPGTHQSIDVFGSPGAQLRAVVTYPDGSTSQFDLVAASDGTAQAQFIQPGNRVTRASQTARVVVQQTAPVGVAPAAAQYAIQFGAVDIWAPPLVRANSTVSLWVHGQPRGKVLVAVRSAGRAVSTATGNVGPRGWSHVWVRVPAKSAIGAGVTFRARVTAGASRHRTSVKVPVG